MAKVHIPYKKRLWVLEHIDYMLTIYKGRLCSEIAEMVNKKFNTSYTTQQVRTFMTNNHYSTGVKTTFKKGSIPNNKGKKWDEYMPKEKQEIAKQTCYKKGNISANNVPIGTITIRKDKNGKCYRYIKVKDGCKEKNFMLYSRWLWEQTYNTKLKRDDVIYHLDGDSLNDDINNLMFTNKKETVTMNKIYKVTDDKNRTKASLLTIRLNQKLKEINKC